MFFDNIYSLKIFNSLDREIVDKIVNNSEEREYNEGDIVIVEGEESNGEGYILKKGRISVSIKGTKIVEMNPGDIFGEIALLNEETRTATVKAETNIKVIVLNMDTMIEILNNDETEFNKTILERIEENLERK